MAKKKIECFKQFSSINDMFRYLDSFGPVTEDSAAGCLTSPTWYASESYDEARQRCVKGDDSLAKMMRGSDKLDIHIPSTGTRKRMMTGVAGFAPHVPNFLAGVPNNMIFVKEQKVQKKVLTVMYGCNTLGDVDPDEIAKVSARVLSCVMSMERKGYRINLYAVNAAEERYVKSGFCVKIKDSGQHIDVLKCAFPLLSAAWNRRFAFRFREVASNFSIHMGHTVYGYELRAFLDKNNVKYDIALGYYDAENVKTVEDLEKLFIESANKLNK